MVAPATARRKAGVMTGGAANGDIILKNVTLRLTLYNPGTRVAAEATPHGMTTPTPLLHG